MASQRYVVLVVEDDAIIRSDIADELASSGWSVLEADCAAQALEICESGLQIDVLVTDIHLGNGTSGWDVARAFWLRDPVPVVYMSGEPDDPQHHVPASWFMLKPCQPSALTEACSRLSERHRNGGG